ncbi:DUF1987 domain-containing protein [Methylogaea oryzae]|uniref:SiaC family regulatory phosphoprotein domain-containing protein n=1 Tax=Methylogaea oryzae TaxID=1295382 RepID=A0A8D5AJW4_9GAMM|nr:DUF1987 domain-containing protein [Methylogaea oryzae]BBL72851.1 hypothetical protein MoryE10_34570 [Methylogaea oryzae]
MTDLHIPATECSPEVDFRFSQNSLVLRGESFPENAAQFYEPILTRLESFLGAANGLMIDVVVELKYFNSASTKMLFNLFALLNGASDADNVVHARWLHDPEDDMILEFGEELQEEFDQVKFTMAALEPA